MAYWETERKPDREIESIINNRFHHCTRYCFFDVKYTCIIHCLSSKKRKGRYIECIFSNCSVFENGCMYMTSVWMYTVIHVHVLIFKLYTCIYFLKHFIYRCSIIWSVWKIVKHIIPGSEDIFVIERTWR